MFLKKYSANIKQIIFIKTIYLLKYYMLSGTYSPSIRVRTITRYCPKGIGRTGTVAKDYPADKSCYI
jgi:hypothetical protein